MIFTLVGCVSSVAPRPRSADDTLLVVRIENTGIASPDNLFGEYVLELDTGERLKIYGGHPYSFHRGLAPGNHEVTKIVLVDHDNKRLQSWPGHDIQFTIEEGKVSVMPVAIQLRYTTNRMTYKKQTLTFRKLRSTEVGSIGKDLAGIREFQRWADYPLVLQTTQASFEGVSLAYTQYIKKK